MHALRGFLCLLACVACAAGIRPFRRARDPLASCDRRDDKSSRACDRCCGDKSLRGGEARDCPGYESLRERNWCGNVEFGAAAFAEPTTHEELQATLRDAGAPIRVVGRGHSFSPVAECSGGTLVSLAKLNRVLDFVAPTEERVGSVTIEGGCTYTEVINFLGTRGALKNLPSCPQFAVAGAIATGTHGSGRKIQNLAAQVSMLEFTLKDGTRTYDRATTPELLEGARVHLGTLGVVSKLTLDVVPYYDVAAYRYDDVPLDDAIEALPELFEACDSLSVWTSGFGRGPGAGLAWMTFRHFEPFWAGAEAAAPPHARPAATERGYLQETPMRRRVAASFRRRSV